MSRPFLVVVILTTAINTGMGIIIPVLPLLLLNFGYSTAGLTLPFIALILGRLISRAFAGWIIRRFTDKYTVIGCFALYALVFVGYVHVTAAEVFIGLRFLEGVVEGISIVCLTDLAITLSSHNRGRRMGLFGSAFGLGFILGPAIGGAVYELLGATAMFLFGALIGGVGLVLSFWLPGGHTLKATAARPWLTVIREYAALLPLYGPTLMRRVLFFSFMILLPLYVTGHLGLSAGHVALFFSGSAIVSTILMPITGHLADKVPAGRIVLLSLGLMGVLVAGFGVVHDGVWFTGLFVAETLAFAFMLPAGMKIFADAVDGHAERSTIIGAFSGLTEAVTLVLAVLLPPLFALDPKLTWFSLGALCLVCAVPYIRQSELRPVAVTG